MTIDMKLIRAMLELIAANHGKSPTVDTAGLCPDLQTRAVHLKWLHDEGLVEAVRDISDEDDSTELWEPQGLTAAGHNYLASLGPR